MGTFRVNYLRSTRIFGFVVSIVDGRGKLKVNSTMTKTTFEEV